MERTHPSCRSSWAQEQTEATNSTRSFLAIPQLELFQCTSRPRHNNGGWGSLTTHAHARTHGWTHAQIWTRARTGGYRYMYIHRHNETVIDVDRREYARAQVQTHAFIHSRTHVLTHAHAHTRTTYYILSQDHGPMPLTRIPWIEVTVTDWSEIYHNNSCMARLSLLPVPLEKIMVLVSYQ